MAHVHNLADQNSYNNKFKIGILLNILFVIAELVFGILSDSLALIADAGHNFSDVIGLLIAWGANYLVQKKPTSQFTYGFKKSTVLAAQLNSLILMVAIGIIIWEAVERLSSPEAVKGETLIIVAGIGVIINGITTYLFHKGKDTDLNIKGAYLHMFADTVISLGVVISGIMIMMTGMFWIDPLISILIAVVIFWGTYKLLLESTKLSLDAVPDSLDIEEIGKYLRSFDKVKDLHDLHVWALSTTESALTVHLIVDSDYQSKEYLNIIQNGIREKYGISHTTIQIEEIECQNGC